MKGAVLGYNLLVLYVLVTLAAILQEGLRPLAWGQVKPPFLLAVATYYALLRPPWIAVLAALWCGWMREGLSGGLPPGVALLGLVLTAAGCTVWGRRQLPETALSCVVVVSAMGALLTWIEFVWLRAGGRIAGWSLLDVGLRSLTLALIAVPVAGLTAWFAMRLDRWALNVRTETDDEGFDWSETRG